MSDHSREHRRLGGYRAVEELYHAFLTGIVLTTITDVAGFFSFLGIATLLMATL